MAIDYGGKRTGIAVTDPLKIIATGLTTIPSHTLVDFLKSYFLTEEVELILIGLPTNWDDTATHGTKPAQDAYNRLKKLFPKITIKQVDERYTSKMAKNAMLDMGMKRKNRQEKGNVDIIAATIILQEYLQ